MTPKKMDMFLIVVLIAALLLLAWINANPHIFYIP